MFKFLGRLRRRQLAKRDFETKRQKLLANRTPLNMELLEVMHLSDAKTRPSGRWEI